MAKIRRNIYFPEQQWERLLAKSRRENLPVAEIVRRAVDAYPDWDDPTYTPHPTPQIRNAHSSPG